MLRQVRLTMTPHASTPVTLVLHPALDLRSAGCGFQTQLCHLGSLRGHPLRRLAPTSSMHRPRSMVAPLLMLLHAPMLRHASSVEKRVTICASAPETTPINLDSPLAVVSQQERLTTPSQPPQHVAMSTMFQLKKLMRIPTSSLVRPLLIAIRQLFFSILDHLIHLSLRAMLDCTTPHLATCPPPWKFKLLVLDGKPLK